AIRLDCGDQTAVFDPFKGIGYEMASTRADFAFISHNHFDHNAVNALDGNPVVVSGKTGEYGNFSLVAYPSYHDEVKGLLRGKNFIHVVTADGFKVAHLGDFGENPDKYDCSPLKGVGVLSVPVGGKFTVDGDGARKIVDKINPKITIPVHYKTERSTIGISSPDKFLNGFKDGEKAFTDGCFVDGDGLKKYINEGIKVLVLKIKE
ncbi:MAG: MBL fold metallo-hydrolase, partial [Clostridia bacterium]|nr:MBL fold metallo-hydrolase [Clostridia bacterium]